MIHMSLCSQVHLYLQTIPLHVTVWGSSYKRSVNQTWFFAFYDTQRNPKWAPYCRRLFQQQTASLSTWANRGTLAASSQLYPCCGLSWTTLGDLWAPGGQWLAFYWVDSDSALTTNWICINLVHRPRLTLVIPWDPASPNSSTLAGSFSVSQQAAGSLEVPWAFCRAASGSLPQIAIWPFLCALQVQHKQRPTLNSFVAPAWKPQASHWQQLN